MDGAWDLLGLVAGWIQTVRYDGGHFSILGVERRACNSMLFCGDLPVPFPSCCEQ